MATADGGAGAGRELYMIELGGDRKMTTAEQVTAGLAGALVRSFLNEIAEGTRTYRSMHSLTRQVEHQYHGRFAIELVQNAHDALRGDCRGRIHFAVRSGGPHGTLYVANDGTPFGVANLKGITRLGQSSKDPRSAIGNKGIGFRSVLEITGEPAIFSRSTREAQSFDGFCFELSPRVHGLVEIAATELFLGRDDVVSPFLAEPLVDGWGARTIANFRASVRREATEMELSPVDWLAREVTLLSPYTVPLPLAGDGDPVIEELRREGYASVLRLPLKSDMARRIAFAKLTEIAPSSLLFLDKAEELTIEIDGERSTFQRTRRVGMGKGLAHDTVTIGTGAADETFRIWSSRIDLSSAPEEVRSALASLPGNWPQLGSALASVATRWQADFHPGTLSIFLPTGLASGSGAFVSSAFFGDMSRTHIEFGIGEGDIPSTEGVFNQHLLARCADLAVQAIEDTLAGGTIDEFLMILDILAPEEPSEVSVLWAELVHESCRRRGVPLAERRWAITSQGWVPLEEARLLPEGAGAAHDILGHAEFPTYPPRAERRRSQLRALYRQIDREPGPSGDDLAVTVERAATRLLEVEVEDADWNAFWAGVLTLMPEGLDALRDRSVLLGVDGRLHAACSPGFTMFFSPRQGVVDDGVTGGIADIPESLQPYVAFLSERIAVTHDINGRSFQNPLQQALLKSRLVHELRRETILQDVVIANTPSLPVPLDDLRASICADLLSWSLRLISSGRGRGESLRSIRRLPVPCLGGWHAMSTTSFGAGWGSAAGDAVESYLSLARTVETDAARERLLQPADHPAWGQGAMEHASLLREAGVFEGLRTITVAPTNWRSTTHSWKPGCKLPEAPPPLFPAEAWGSYRGLVEGTEPSYRENVFELQSLQIVPGMLSYETFDEATREAFSNVALWSIGAWSDWETLKIERKNGLANTLEVMSPLAHWLRTTSWVPLPRDAGTIWTTPSGRWHVPALHLSTRYRWHFDHLDPLPFAFARRLDEHIGTRDALRALGVRRLRLEEESADTNFLEALAQSVVDGRVPNRNVLLGQIRSAWSAFYPTTHTVGLSRLLYQSLNGDIETMARAEGDGLAYIPDSVRSASTLRAFGLPVLAMEVSDARRLADWLVGTWPGRLRRSSELSPRPFVDGQEWVGGAGDLLATHPDYGWIAPAALAVMAFHGPSAQGMATASFRQKLELLRSACVLVAGDVRTGLYASDTPVSPIDPVASLWVPDGATMLISQGCASAPELLADAFAGLLERDDLGFVIRVLLERCGPAPHLEKIETCFEAVALTASHFHSVWEQWRGDLSPVLDRIVPLALAREPACDVGSLLQCDSERELLDTLVPLLSPELDASEVVALSRSSISMAAFARQIYDRARPRLDLAEWNEALATLGRPQLRNDEARDDFGRQVDLFEPLSHAILAHVARGSDDALLYSKHVDDLRSIGMPPRFETDRFEILPADFLAVFASGIEGWGVEPDVVLAVRDASCIGEARSNLAELGVDVAFDPAVTERDNLLALRSTWAQVCALGLAWSLKTDAPVPERWSSAHEAIDAVATSHAPQITRWSEDRRWRVVASVPAFAGHEAFFEHVASSTSPQDLRGRLGLAEDDIRKGDEELERRRAKAELARQTVSICGASFLTTEGYLGRLWSHISAQAKDHTLETVRLDSIASLDPLQQRPRRGRPARPSRSGRRASYQTRSQEMLIGLAGEIHAFRMLRQSYGEAVVTPLSWVSENSLYVFQTNPVHDGAGYDLKVCLEKETVYVEVKSSDGEHESITLGSSQIIFAMDMATKAHKARRNKKALNERFVIMRVIDALGSRPTADILPNPYDERFRAFFQLEDADARVRYRKRG